MVTGLVVRNEHGYWGEECREPLTTLGVESSVTVDGELVTPGRPASPAEAVQTLIDPLGIPAE